MQPKVSAAGDRGLLADLGNVSASELRSLARGVRTHPEVLACVPGQQTLFILFKGQPNENVLRPAPTAGIQAAPRQHSINVSFADEYATDLAAFLHHVGVAREHFFARLSSLTLTARYLGFRGGFAYLDGWPSEWSMPRRPTSRPVKRGSFAIAGATAGFYPLDTPGGWNILGRTSAELEHAIEPGDEIRIVPTDERLAFATIRRLPGLTIEGVEILGPLTTVVGIANVVQLERGLPPGGPFDERAAAIANRLTGNRVDAPLVECALVGPSIRFATPRWVAWCGAECDLPDSGPFLASELNIGRIRKGMRGYLAIAASDDRPAESESLEREARAHAERVRGTDRRVIRVLRGPHVSTLGSIECEVTPQLDRVGIRLRPLRDLGLTAPADLPSCGMQFGTIQLHPDGSLVAMGPDHPVTGGYLQPLTVVWDERWKLGQLMPGETVRFVAD